MKSKLVQLALLPYIFNFFYINLITGRHLLCRIYVYKTKVDPELLIKPKLKRRSYSAGKWSRLRSHKLLAKRC